MVSVVATVARGNPFRVVRLVKINDVLFRCPFWPEELDFEMATLIAEAINVANHSKVTNLLMQTNRKKWKKSITKYIEDKNEY